MADLPEKNSKRPLPLGNADKPLKGVWLCLLIVYLSLFVSTGYLAFLNIEVIDPEASSYEKIITMEDGDTKTFIIEALKMEDAERSTRQSLVTHSFNVVLGALLGFMSASATSLVRRKDDG